MTTGLIDRLADLQNRFNDLLTRLEFHETVVLGLVLALSAAVATGFLVAAATAIGLKSLYRQQAPVPVRRTAYSTTPAQYSSCASPITRDTRITDISDADRRAVLDVSLTDSFHASQPAPRGRPGMKPNLVAANPAAARRRHVPRVRPSSTTRHVPQS